MNQEITRLEHKATDSKEAFGFINGWNSCVALLESQSTHSAADEIERLRGVLAGLTRYGCHNYTSGTCFDYGRIADAEYADDQACSACIALAAMADGEGVGE
jgi:hypothetical protein